MRMVTILVCLTSMAAWCGDVTCVAQQFVQYMNRLESLQASYRQKENDKALSSGKFFWRRPFLLSMQTEFKGAPMTIVVNQEGSFIFNEAYQSLTTLDTARHALRNIFASPLVISEVSFLRKTGEFYVMRITKKDMWLDVLCTASGVLQGWIAPGTEHVITLLDHVVINEPIPDDTFRTPKAPSALERNAFWARQAACAESASG